MNLTLTGGTARQRQWVQDAIQLSTFDWDSFNFDVEVQWVSEPPCPGHKEYACTQTDESGNSVIYIRDTLDDGTIYKPPWGGKLFYMETAIHELMHAAWFARATATDITNVVGWFSMNVVGEGKVIGTAADYDPLDKPWADRIQEAIAETLKDIFLPETYREGDNRTNWTLDKTYLNLLMQVVGTRSGTSGGLFEGPGYVYAGDGTGHAWEAHQWKRLPDTLSKLASLTIGVDHSAPDIAHNIVTSGGYQVRLWYAMLAAPPGHADPAPTPWAADYAGPLTYDQGGLPPGSPFRGTVHELEQQGFIPLLGQWTQAAAGHGGDYYSPAFNTTPDWEGAPNQEQPPVDIDYDHWMYVIYQIQGFLGGTLTADAPYPPVATQITPAQPADGKYPYTDPHIGAGPHDAGVIRIG